MSKSPLLLVALIVASPAAAQQFRDLDAHEHGVTELALAFAGDQVAIDLHAPGVDLVGFEYTASSDEELAAIERALTALSEPLSLFEFPEAAGCSVIDADVALQQGEHEDHDDAHDDHAEDHAEDAEGAIHSEFEAEYLLSCTDVTAIDAVTMTFFDAFPNAQSLEIVVFTTAGAQSFDLDRAAPVLDLGDAS